MFSPKLNKRCITVNVLDIIEGSYKNRISNKIHNINHVQKKQKNKAKAGKLYYCIDLFRLSVHNMHSFSSSHGLSQFHTYIYLFTVMNRIFTVAVLSDVRYTVPTRPEIIT